MSTLLFFIKLNTAYYNYILYFIALLIFGGVARIINHFIELGVEKSEFGKRGIAKVFTPFLILLFFTAGESLFFILFRTTSEMEKSFTFFLNTQIIWVIFWIAMAGLKFRIYEMSLSRVNVRKYYPALRTGLLLVLLAVTVLKNGERIISSFSAFIATLLLLRLSYIINRIPLIRVRPPQEIGDRIVARWDSFSITLPYNIPKEIIDQAIKIAETCVRTSDNVGERSTVLLKDLSERGIVIEVKYLVLVSSKMKETKHAILSHTLKSFSDQKIPMSTS
ncbi:MAG: hypothetical protein E3J78_06830 [Candidatus Cloacimonadota bacterium]|nr:MAG: hypothetical protein E3J78_06830 [Candidatus Cloacimonadota bacterium]